MAGHSKWNNIKRRKEAADQKRGKIFTKLGREIQVAVREGGPDPEENFALQSAIARARSYNMPNDNIKRSIDNASGAGGGEEFVQVTYEGYGAGGVAVMVRTLTDNRNRTAGEVRHVFEKYGGNLGKDGSVAYQFENKGSLIIAKDKYPDEDQVMLDALDAGCEDIEISDDYYEVVTDPSEYHKVLQGLTAAEYEFADVSLGPEAMTFAQLTDPDQIEKIEKLLDGLEEIDDVQDVFHNWEQEEE
ncbi:MAG: YebC/PmpR family DNA-binding transcriptional regulator [Clostridiaceae bacterium]|jgi:YebC/PmpR family DNA-binding regulatory protein|nr:YebC/PmpR family DNA-binding transcriptional regulator [Bacillota bacterium]NLN51379.1 YebC/PmpR family DNA-binding transcriptional regulator [Clostridiaceae bacterium]